ncbi:hypothetical protein [Paracidovorax sp. MALMAid1276]|uniref:hypothetical protein n=1 Tax=Paracidovorax sp. MALMAid1276 TaxID=3411631 RepID=UPI003B999BA0
MKVKAVTQEIDDIFFEENLIGFAFSSVYENIQIDKEYVVQAVVFWKSIPFYYIYEYDEDSYPKPVCYKYFAVIDDSLPQCWKLIVDRNLIGGFQSFLIFKEWAENIELYERLVDGDEQALEIFTKYRNLLRMS